jgi:hypothetical protein
MKFFINIKNKIFNLKMKLLYLNIYVILFLLIFSQSITLSHKPKFLSFKQETFSKEYISLVNYIKNNDGYINPKLTINEKSLTNRFILTKEDIQKDETILFIPEKILISKLHVNVNRKCVEAYGFEQEDDHDYECLVYFMTLDKYNSSSMFKPYYDFLPKIDKNDFIISLTKEEIEQYKETGIPEGINSFNHFFHKALDPVKERLKHFAEKNKIKYEQILEDFLNNFILVGTRNFGRPGFFADFSTMVPYLDLINHSDKNNTHWFYDEHKEGYYLIAVRDIKKNEELTDSYGKYFNSYLFKTYGFVIPGNIYPDNVPTKVNGESYTLTIEFLKDHVERMYEKLLKSKNVDFNEAKNIILKDLNDKKNYYLGLKTKRFSMNVIIKEHLEILNAYIKEVENFDINSIN